MASVFLYHVVGDLMVAKPEMVEFLETAIQTIGESTEGRIPVWQRKPQNRGVENSEMRQQRFVGILNSLDIVAFLAKDWCLEDQEKAMKTPVSEIVVPNNSLLKEVDPATRSGESNEHLFLHCSFSWKIWSKVFDIFGEDCVCAPNLILHKETRKTAMEDSSSCCDLVYLVRVQQPYL